MTTEEQLRRSIERLVRDIDRLKLPIASVFPIQNALTQANEALALPPSAPGLEWRPISERPGDDEVDILLGKWNEEGLGLYQQIYRKFIGGKDISWVAKQHKYTHWAYITPPEK